MAKIRFQICLYKSGSVAHEVKLWIACNSLKMKLGWVIRSVLLIRTKLLMLKVVLFNNGALLMVWVKHKFFFLLE